MARRLHASRYLAEGYVDRLDPGGVIDDEYVQNSTYFIASNEHTGETVGTCRVIDSDTHSFPMLDHMTIDPEWRELLLETPSKHIGEVSALVAVRGDQTHLISAALCREAFRSSLTTHPRRYLLCIVDRLFLRLLNSVFRAGLTAVGPTQEYLGRTIPTVASVERSLLDLRDRSDAFGEFFRDGLDIASLADAVIDLRGDHALVLPPAHR